MAQSQDTKARHPMVNRILHWIIMVSIILLALTGFYIHAPFISNGVGFLMAMMRGVHFAAAGILAIAFIVRVIWMLVGPRCDWKNFIVGFRDMLLLPKVLLHYAHIAKKPVIVKKYNPLQMLAYCFAYILVLFQIITGFALQYPDGILRPITYSVFGNVVNLRVAHYIVSWVFVIFIMIHVYMAIRESFEDVKEMQLFSKGKSEHSSTEKAK
jgi:Ni/Fe-hydrogenase 1 B-type cytochrome subunit